MTKRAFLKMNSLSTICAFNRVFRRTGFYRISGYAPLRLLYDEQRRFRTRKFILERPAILGDALAGKSFCHADRFARQGYLLRAPCFRVNRDETFGRVDRGIVPNIFRSARGAR